MFLNEAEKHSSDDKKKKNAKLVITFFQMLSQTQIYLTTVIIFHKKTHILSQSRS